MQVGESRIAPTFGLCGVKNTDFPINRLVIVGNANMQTIELAYPALQRWFRHHHT